VVSGICSFRACFSIWLWPTRIKSQFQPVLWLTVFIKTLFERIKRFIKKIKGPPIVHVWFDHMNNPVSNEAWGWYKNITLENFLWKRHYVHILNGSNKISFHLLFHFVSSIKSLKVNEKAWKSNRVETKILQNYKLNFISIKCKMQNDCLNIWLIFAWNAKLFNREDWLPRIIHELIENL